MNNPISHALLLTLLLSGTMVRSTRAADDPPAPAPADPTLAGDEARAIKETIKHDAKVAAAAAKDGAQQVAGTAKAVAHEVASASKEGAQQVAATAKRGGSAVKATVTGEKPVKPTPETMSPPASAPTPPAKPAN